MNPSLKILISYHKKATLIENNFFVPIQLGRAISNQLSKDGYLSKDEIDWFNNNMIGDDTGDNISYLNRYLSENTGFYWAWKNYDKLGNPDYIGFMHYRRHLIFDPTKIQYAHHIYCFDHFYELYNEDEYKYLDKYLYDLYKYDIIRSNMIKLNRTVAEELAIVIKMCNLDPTICQKVLDTVKTQKKDYAKALELNLNSDNHFWYNCFIMKKELFFEYAQFLFDILFVVNKEIDYEKYKIKEKCVFDYLERLKKDNHLLPGKGINEQRVLTYMAERLFGIFVTQKTIFENKKFKCMPLSFIYDPYSYK